MSDVKLKYKILEIYYDLCDEIKHKRIQQKYSLPIMNSEETIKYIKQHNCSIARYGDGEFGLMLEKSCVSFQKSDHLLAEALKRVLKSNMHNLLLCVPYPMINTKEFVRGQFWRGWSLNNQKEVVEFIKAETKIEGYFGDACISRPFSGYKSSKNAKKMFPMWKEIWHDRDVIFVEGEETRLGVGNNLFDNCRSIKRILAPAKNAFSVYPKILDSVTSNWKGELVIIALGPTATVLACDLSQKGIQALDLGHIDIQYEWFLAGKSWIAVKNKYTNESPDNSTIVDCDDSEYNSQIIDNISI